MNFSRLLFFSQLAALSAGRLWAQHDHSAHGHPSVNMENVVITATPLERDQSRIAASTSILAGDKLNTELKSSLGETLSNLPGIASSYFGPGASRPVIRGLDGDRIRVLSNSLGSQDASVVSPDHAVAIDPLIIERVEVIRGPAALLYGGNAIGGVVNVLDHRIHHRTAEKEITGRAATRFSSVDDGNAQAALVEGSAGNVAWHLDGYRRETSDVEIPGYAYSSAMLAEEIEERIEHGEALDFAHGTLPNSGTRTDGGAAGLSFTHDRGFVGLSYSGHNSLYGVPPGAHHHGEEEEPEGEEAPEHPEDEYVRIDLRQRRLDLQGELRDPFPGFELAKLKAGISRYRHLELEGGEIGTVFHNRAIEGRLELVQSALGNWEGALGGQFARSKFSAVGEEAFLPPSSTEQYGLFLFEEFNAGRVTYQLGARADHQEIKLRDESGRKNRESSFSVSAGAVWTIADNWSLSGTVARNERAPNVQELFADGAHVGTSRYEVGDATLSTESSVSGEIILRRRSGPITGEISLFAYRFADYIFPSSTAEVDPESGLEILRYVQTDALFRGGEADLIVHLHADHAHTLDLRLGVDLVRGKLRHSSESLPRVTPRRARASLEYQRGGWSAGIGAVGVERAKNLAPNESPTPGYVLLNAQVRYTVELGRVTTSVYLNGENLSDRTARNHVSFLKEIAPLPGRNVTAGIELNF